MLNFWDSWNCCTQDTPPESDSHNQVAELCPSMRSEAVGCLPARYEPGVTFRRGRAPRRYDPDLDDYDPTNAANVMPVRQMEIMWARADRLRNEMGKLEGVIRKRSSDPSGDMDVLEHYAGLLTSAQEEYSGLMQKLNVNKNLPFDNQYVEQTFAEACHYEEVCEEASPTTLSTQSSRSSNDQLFISKLEASPTHDSEGSTAVSGSSGSFDASEVEVSTHGASTDSLVHLVHL